MNNTIKTRKTSNGWTVSLVKIGSIFVVTSVHDKKKGYATRYSGQSIENAEKHYSR